MAEKLVPDGTLILNELLEEVGKVTRATATSAWVGDLRLVQAGRHGSGSLRGYKDQSLYVVAGSTRHTYLVEREAWRAKQTELDEAHRASIALRDQVQRQMTRRADETHKQHMARLKHAADVLRVALEGEHV